jgi:hypothetical protein
MVYIGDGRKSPELLRFVLRTNRAIYDVLNLLVRYMQRRGHEISELLDEVEKLDK